MSERPKEHDWKSCVRHKRTMGSNPILCAMRKKSLHYVAIFHIFKHFLDTKNTRPDIPSGGVFSDFTK